MPDTLIQFRNLIKLDLSHNNLTEIQISTFRGLHKLRILDLSCNQIANIEAGCFKEFKLIQLDLSRNKLTKLDASLFCTLSHLEILVVKCNKLDNKTVYMLLKLQNNGTRVITEPSSEDELDDLWNQLDLH